MLRAAIVSVVLTAPYVTGSLLRQAPGKLNNDATPSRADEITKVAQLHSKLTQVSKALLGLASGQKGNTHVASMVGKVNAELQKVLAETAHPQDVKKAFKQLGEANSIVQQLSTDLTNEQVKLMHEGNDQAQSLLLGVLMRRQSEPISKQLEVMHSHDFAMLPVVVAVLAAKDMKTPLFKQVAAWLDAHQPSSPKVETQIPEKLRKGTDGKPDVTPIVLALESNLQKMGSSEKRMADHHEAEMKELDRLMVEKSNNTRAVHQIQRMKKRDQRDFAKQAAISKQDLQTLTSAIESVKKGDLAGLAKAQKALESTMRTARAQNGKFLVLVQLMNHASGMDCPYCAAQCVDKCHNEGKSYVVCLADCADAGK